jgi:hypothetical protein
MRATCSPAAKRWRMTAMTWRLAAAFCSSAQVGSSSSPVRISVLVPSPPSLTAGPSSGRFIRTVRRLETTVEPVQLTTGRGILLLGSAVEGRELGMLAPASLSNVFSQPWWQAVGAILTGIGVLVAAATLIPVSRSVTQASKSFRIGLLENQQQTYRTGRLQDIRHELEQELKDKIERNTLNENDKKKLNDLVSFFEFLAILVELKALKFRDVYALFPTGPYKYWRHLEAYVKLRQQEEPELFQNYPKLVARYGKQQAAKRLGGSRKDYMNAWIAGELDELDY